MSYMPIEGADQSPVDERVTQEMQNEVSPSASPPESEAMQDGGVKSSALEGSDFVERMPQQKGTGGHLDSLVEERAVETDEKLTDNRTLTDGDQPDREEDALNSHLFPPHKCQKQVGNGPQEVNSNVQMEILTQRLCDGENDKCKRGILFGKTDEEMKQSGLFDDDDFTSKSSISNLLRLAGNSQLLPSYLKVARSFRGGLCAKSLIQAGYLKQAQVVRLSEDIIDLQALRSCVLQSKKIERSFMH
ncbi:hypothetical protein GUITHDRAFT_103727 [Guillardia theta CCMP2712]|uniref:Uncharacterized protein n=1 Tax=Guillardia theta (strain CCMP2712) TaxID=905079 RepID=L1JPH9_GUITC|nr:hypothetical protein GUITHDRAFT_103727 [Guillardia theta CCMP2712]EKX50496.1 hypothetical protein GUITHDRAFT_103727 [Guillardia theta CCMP2712]|eukprot:XP_005837476.1 hypothetical protein GUITHDRAFT_103727 [Guillardia theta CCMP2712]